MRSPRTSFAASLLLGALAIAPLQAQSWTAIGTPDNVSAGQQFWDNASTDGQFCNSGFVVTGVAGTAGKGCTDQRPTGWLPYNGPTPTTYLEASGGGFQGFLFGAGNWSFSLLSGALPGGDIAGMNTDWGYFDVATTTRTSLGSGPLPVSPVAMAGAWGLWIQLTNGGYAYSNLDNQFALFGFNAAGSGDAGTEWIAGLEDTFTGNGGGSDKDYQDVLFNLRYDGGGSNEEVIPEPGTMLLFGSGLAGVIGRARRRRNG